MEQNNCPQRVLNCLCGQPRHKKRGELLVRVILQGFGTQETNPPKISPCVGGTALPTPLQDSAKMGCLWMHLLFSPIYIMLYSYIVLKKTFLSSWSLVCLPLHGRAPKTAGLCPQHLQWSLCKVIHSPAIPLLSKLHPHISFTSLLLNLN